MMGEVIREIRPWFALDENIIDEIDDWHEFEQKCINKLNTPISIDELLGELYDIAVDLGFFDKVKNMLNNDGQYLGRTGILYEIQNYINNHENDFGEEKVNIMIKNSQFEEQFNAKGKDENEKYANIIYLSNAIARILQTSSKQFKGKLQNVNHLVKIFYDLKTQCMINLLENRKNGIVNGMLISHVIDENLELRNEYFLISIPGYLEPFRVQFDYKSLEKIKERFNEEEPNLFDKLDYVPFFSMQSNFVGEYLKSIFPLKLTPQIESVLYNIYINSPNGNKSIKPFVLERIRYYCEYLPEITTKDGRKLARLRIELSKLTSQLNKLKKALRRYKTPKSKEKIIGKITDYSNEISKVEEQMKEIKDGREVN